MPIFYDDYYEDVFVGEIAYLMPIYTKRVYDDCFNTI